MTRVAHIKRSTDKPRHGTQLPLPGLGLPDRPAPLLLEEKGLGDEVHATKERPLLNLTYSYDEENNITGISNSAFAVNGLGGNYGYNYEYDAMYRLTGAYGGFTDNNDNDFTFELAMSYSPSGNILSKSMDALTFQSTMGGVVAVNYNNNYQYHPAKPHAISSITGSGTDHQMEWDANGNLTHHVRTGDGNESLRQLCWDEENRLTAVRDQNHLSAYIYDAGGERVWKLTGQVQQMQIGGGGVVDVVDLNNKTLYASPYLVYNEQGYSKHYYAGAERVSSRIGGGMQNALVDPLNSALAHLSDHDNYNAIASDLYDMLMRAAECAGMTRKYVSMALDFGIIYETTGWSSHEPNWYIYHSDHLGSSAFLTDASGDPTQHLQYMPFGENFVEQRSVTSYYTPYTFSAKERDTETGYSYFGARYYDADISVWLSVDPMSDKNFGISPYNYCHWNPLNLIDPDGRDDEEPLKNVILLIRQDDPNEDGSKDYTEEKKANQPGDFQNWHTIVATDIVDAMNQLETYLGGAKLDNLIINSHGNTDVMQIAQEYRYSQDGTEYIDNRLFLHQIMDKADILSGIIPAPEAIVNSLKALESITNMVNDNGNLIFNSCNTGEGHVAFLSHKAFNSKINYFGNNGKGLLVGQTSHKVQMGPLSSSFFSNKSQTPVGNIDIADDKSKPLIIHPK
jgi:RHS repeat-associated protein